VPVLSGGLLGISKRWWNETGGYDEKMIGWGGENIDQSLRSWLCGGEIMIAQDAFVAHMWRVPSDPRTAPRYVVKAGAANANRARAAVAWFGEFSEKLASFGALAPGRQTRDGRPWYGDIENILEVKRRLQCRSFAWFMHRFKSVYEDAGLIPAETFGLRAAPGGKCLVYVGQAGTSPDGHGRAVLRECNPNDERQRWHAANRDTYREGACCSGLRAWNTDQCIQSVQSGVVRTGVCDVSGQSRQQAWAFSEGQLRRSSSGFSGFMQSQCIVPDRHGNSLEASSCSSASGTGWVKDTPIEPPETRLYRKAMESEGRF